MSDDTWTKPAHLKYVRVTVVGGGGSGNTYGTGRNDPMTSIGGGGGGGGSAMATIVASALGNTETITVGSGGAGGAVSDTLGTGQRRRLKYVQSDGSAGEASAFGTHCTASGGRGGPTCVYVPQNNNKAQAIAGGGAGGVGSEGANCTALLFHGRRGEQGLTTTYREHKMIYDGLCYTGSGGDSFLGGGGESIAPTTAASFVSTTGNAGTANTGGGGGGSLTVATDSGASKRSGGSGLVIVEAFF